MPAAAEAIKLSLELDRGDGNINYMDFVRRCVHAFLLLRGCWVASSARVTLNGGHDREVRNNIRSTSGAFEQLNSHVFRQIECAKGAHFRACGAGTHIISTTSAAVILEFLLQPAWGSLIP